MSEQQETTAVVEETQLVPFSPENVNQAWKLACKLAQSALVPRALQGKPNDLLVTLITGRELGLSPMQAIRGMHVIEGKAVMSADLMAALVIGHSECEYLRLIDSTDKLAVYETKRKGHPNATKMAFTIEDANRAGLTGKDNWKRYPAAMLRARACSAICRAVYPDLIGGVYEADEAPEILRTPTAELTPAPGGSKLDALTAELAQGETIDRATGEILGTPASPGPATMERLDAENFADQDPFGPDPNEADAAVAAERRKSTHAAAVKATEPKAAPKSGALPFTTI